MKDTVSLLIKKENLPSVMPVPSSKSAFIRELFIAAFAGERAGGKEIKIYFSLSLCDDVLNTVEVLTALGAVITVSGDADNGVMHIIPVSGKALRRAENESVKLEIRESATLFNFTLCFAAVFGIKAEISVGPQLSARPLRLDFYSSLPGFTAEMKKGAVYLNGRLKENTVTVPEISTSQIKSGFALAFASGNGGEVISADDVSRPYFRLTEKVIFENGGNVTEKDGKTVISPCTLRDKYSVPADMSAAAALLCLGAAAGKKISITGNFADIEKDFPDFQIIDFLSLAGFETEIRTDGIKLFPAEKTRGVSFDFTDCPDLFCPAAALAPSLDGTSRFTSLSRLSGKESPRVNTFAALAEETGIAFSITEYRNGLPEKAEITGKRTPETEEPVIIHTPDDHRIAMAAAIISVSLEHGGIIKNAGCLSKSFPDFGGITGAKAVKPD